MQLVSGPVQVPTVFFVRDAPLQVLMSAGIVPSEQE